MTVQYRPDGKTSEVVPSSYTVTRINPHPSYTSCYLVSVRETDELLVMHADGLDRFSSDWRRFLKEPTNGTK